MHDSNISSNRLDDLLNTITEAKKSLTHWQDKRTEALIRLDAFTYDIKLLEDEKKQTLATIAELKKNAEISSSRRLVEVGELTDQLQLLKYENELLRKENFQLQSSIQAKADEYEFRNAELANRVIEMAKQKMDAEIQSQRLEKEIAQIRSQMRKLLDFGESGGVDPSINGAMAKDAIAIDNKNLRAVEFEQGSVEDYLKRFGY